MNILKNLFTKKETSIKLEKTHTTHAMVVNEIRFLAYSVLNNHYPESREKIVNELNQDPMDWFTIRGRQYGESGSRYGIAELQAKPGDPGWPTWPQIIPVSDRFNVAREMDTLSEERRPLGGHNMDDENQQIAASEFACHILYRMFEAEKQARKN